MSAPLTFWLSKEKARITSSQLGPDHGHLESFSGKSVVNSPCVNLLVLKRRSACTPAGLCARLPETELPGRKPECEDYLHMRLMLLQVTRDGVEDDAGATKHTLLQHAGEDHGGGCHWEVITWARPWLRVRNSPGDWISTTLPRLCRVGPSTPLRLYSMNQPREQSRSG